MSKDCHNSNNVGKKIYLVCPVRNCTPDQKIEMDEYVRLCESFGHQVHYPPRDVDQTDPTGITICTEHGKFMETCDEVHLFWDVNSKGSHFDLGMAWALKKPVILITAYESDPNNKSYLKVIANWPWK
jgi:nucleoside 2-deoxyribosyltransferase